jgi:hypothetical protein
MSASSRHDIYSVKELKRSRELSMIGAIVPAVGLREPSGDERYFSLCKIARKVGAILTLPCAPLIRSGLAGSL